MLDPNGQVRLGDSRFLNSIVATWKVTDKLTSIADFNYAADEGVDAEAYGVAQYLTYAVNDRLSLGVRGEIWRDDDGFFATQFGNYNDPLDLQRGDIKGLDPRTIGGGATTYSAVTVGANVKLHDRVLIRPEVRYDSAIAGARNKPFDDSTDKDQFTASIDVILTF